MSSAYRDIVEKMQAEHDHLLAEIARRDARISVLEGMVADHPMVPARDPELNRLIRQARGNGWPRGIPRHADWERLTPVERSIRSCLIDVEKLGAHRLLTDAVVLLERAQERVGYWVDLDKSAARAALQPSETPKEEL